jgi:hypothetical protein
MSYEVRFVTSADSRFFLGVVAMLNSLRLRRVTAQRIRTP